MSHENCICVNFFDELFQFVNCNENRDIVKLIENLFNDCENYFQMKNCYMIKNVFNFDVFIFDVIQKFVKYIFREKKLSMRDKCLSIYERNRLSRFFILNYDKCHD